MEVPEPGQYAFYLEHFPHEFDLCLSHVDSDTPLVSTEENEYLDDHEHDETVTSVAIAIDEALDPELLNAWIMEFLSEHGPDIFRMKGVLNISGQSDRYVFHGVHMLFDIEPQRPWLSDEKRHSEMSFIGRNLDRQFLHTRFLECRA